jgi:Holliday junction resolvasome RuvABC DNA-binding subunit
MSLMVKLSEMVPTPVETIKLVVFGKTPEPLKTLAELTLKDGDFMIMTIKPVESKKLENPKEMPAPIGIQHEEEKKEIKPLEPTLPSIEKPKIEFKIEDKEEKKELPKKEEPKKEEPKKEEKKEEPKKEEPKKEEQKKEEKKEMPKKEEKKNTGNNSEQLNILISMGFTVEQSNKALQLSANNVELAIDLITSGELNNVVNNSHPDPSHNIEMQNMLAGIQGQPGNNYQEDDVIIPDVLSDTDKEAIESIKAMGFKEEDIKKAYFGSGKNKENTINYLLENSQ